MTITSLHIANATPKTTAGSSSTSRTRIVELPARFDVHQVDAFLAEVSKDTNRLATTTLDGAAVEMIDMAALRSLAGVVAEFPDLTIARPSVALRATAQCTGNDALSKRMTLADTPYPALVQQAA